MIDHSLEKGFRLGSIRVYPLDSRIETESGEKQLSPIGMELLYELAQANGETVTAQHLIAQIWGNKAPSEGTLEHYASELNYLFDAESDAGSIVINDGDGLYRLAQNPSPLATDSGTDNDSLQIESKRKRSFIDELGKRKVSQTGVLYLLAAWVILQFTDVAFEALGLGDELIRLILITAVVGFPITLVLAWFYDVKRTNDTQESAPTTRRVAYVMGGALVALPIAFAYQWIYLGELASTSSTENALEYEAKPNSIAVLAFENLGNDTSYDYFGDGIAEEILNALSSTGEMLVAPRTSSFIYKNNSSIGIKDIGKQLGVRYVLEGTVRRVGDQVRVVAKLINVSSGFQIWSNPYNQGISNIFDVQQDISRKVVQSLNIVLSSEKNEALGAVPTSSVEAYDFYLQGRDYLNRPATQSSLNSAIQLFTNAIELDPQYSDAYAGLCDSYLEQYKETDTGDWFAKAEKACKDSLEFELVTVEVRVALGNLYRQSGQYDRSLMQLEFALEKEPDNIDALSAFAKASAKRGNAQEAEVFYRKAINVQPRFWRTQEDLGNFLFDTGRPDEAIEYYQQTIELTPDNASAFNNLGAALLMTNQFEAAAEAWKKSLAIEDNESASSNAGSALFMAGKFDQAAEMYLRATKLAKDKHILWGNLGDAQRLGSRPENATEHYSKAINLAEQSLKINANDNRTIAMLSHYYSHLGQTEQAIELIKRATAEDTRDVYVWYYAALTWLTLDNKKVAMQSLQRAIKLGYPAQMVLNDVGLNGLTSDSGYRDQLGL